MVHWFCGERFCSGWLHSHGGGDPCRRLLDGHFYFGVGSFENKALLFYAGPLIQFPHSFVPQLVSLGVPAALEKGVAVLTQDHYICRPGEKLSPEQAKLLVSLHTVVMSYSATSNLSKLAEARQRLSDNPGYILTCAFTLGP